MKRALIGYTGFVGGNLDQQTAFTDRYNSKNISDLAGQSYDLVVSAGQRAEKWKINVDPEADRANIRKLTNALDQVDAKQFVLISTIDVYAKPVEVDEDAMPDWPEHPDHYGENRLSLEKYVMTKFEQHLVVRLPALFGPGLKKNIIYDFLTDNRDYFSKIHADSTFQYYDLAHLWSDISKALKLGIPLLNVATEPISVAEVAKDCFGFEFDGRPPDMTPVEYDFRSIHAEDFGGQDGYLYDKSQVKDDLKRFVANWKEPK